MSWVLLLVGSFVLWSDRMANGLDRLIRPFAFVPVQGSVRILKVTPGSRSVTEGEDVPIQVVIKSEPGRHPKGHIFYRTGNGAETAAPLTLEAPGRYSTVLRNRRFDTEYRVEVGGTESRRFRLSVEVEPRVRTLSARLVFPAYTGQAVRDEKKFGGHVRAVIGTRVDLVWESDRPARKAFLRFD